MEANQLKATELRIGNYVSCQNWSPYRIEAVDIHHCHYHPEAYKPIPLTEDILVKLGFEIDSVDRPRLYADYKVINPITKDYMIELKNVGKGWFYRNGYFKIDYVHQLQNLYFALCGEELTFKKW